ncbi:MAG: hypothetical protein RLO01_10330 [Thalassobaculaceae bacterium]
MSVTEATAQANPSWWSTSGPTGEADPSGPETGGTDESLGFADFIDIINPLQHLPVVGTLYRELTGDTMSETARMAGGVVWGGPAGLVGALANTITERESGGDLGATALAMARGGVAGDDPAAPAADPETALAAAPASAAPTPLGPPSPAVAQFAAAAPAGGAGAQPALASVSNPAAASAAAQEFSGNAASRLDAFIQRASAVRTADQVPVRDAVQSRAGAELTATAAAMKSAPPRAPTAAASAPDRSEAPAPLRLASDGNTDVAHWMMRALDRYETMKTTEQS